MTDLRERVDVPLCCPDEPLYVALRCRPCYEWAWRNRVLGRPVVRRPHRRPAPPKAPTKPQRSRADYVADYELLRSEGYTRSQIAERLGMTRAAVDQAYRRALAAGALTPDRRTT